MVQLNKNDLDFILRQIKIAEAHVAASNAGTDPRLALEQLVSSPLLPYGLRTVDGSFNNFQPGMARFGSADQPMVRLLDAQFSSAEANPRTGQPTSYGQPSGSVYDSQPRIISNLVADQSLNNPAAISAALASVGITGADALTIVGEVMQLQAAVTQAQAAVATAATSAAAARSQAQAVVNSAQNTVAAAQQTVTALQGELSALVNAAAQGSAALTAAEAAVVANQIEVGAAQADVAAKLALMQAASDAAAATQSAENLALANLTVAEIARNNAANSYSANPNQASADALAQATLAYNAARTAYEVAQQNDEAADAALVVAQAAHTAAVTILQGELDQQVSLVEAAELAEAGQVAAEAAVAAKTVELNAANADLAEAQADLAGAQANLQALPQTDAAAIAIANAAVTAAKAAVIAELTSHGVEMDGNNVFIKNIAADLGDTASFNGFMTIFGQFFDHGLDLTTKGGSGSVYIPLQPDDPLYVVGSQTNFMVLTRATNAPGADGVIGTADDVRNHTNETTPWIDLNQVYTSNPSHQVFLREYVLVGGKPVATGQMLESATGGPPTWKDIKTQAELCSASSCMTSTCMRFRPC